MQNNCGIKIGDKVKVLRKAKSFENGWACSWNEEMDEYVGRTGKVFDIAFFGIDVEFYSSSWYFPFFVLEKVEEEYYCIGDKFRIEGSEYVLLNTDYGRVALISLTYYNRHLEPVTVGDIYKVTKEEMKRLTLFDFELIEKSPLRKER
jgi:hypothetical protein